MKFSAYPFLIFCTLMTGLFSCVPYQRYMMPVERLQKVPVKAAALYAIDAAHPLTRVWYVAEARTKGDRIEGFFTRLSDIEALEVGVVRDQQDAKNSRNDLLIYINPKLAMGFSDTLTAQIPMNQIERIEVHEPNYGKMLGSTLTSVAAFVFVVSYFSMLND